MVKKERPAAPAPNPQYQTLAQLALKLMEQFRRRHSHIKVKSVVADALYGQAKFMDAAAALFGGVQVISQLHHNQNIRYRNSFATCEYLLLEISRGGSSAEHSWSSSDYRYRG